jgi:hypothetical protein
MPGEDGRGGRTIERLAREQGYEIHPAPHCREGSWFQVGERVLILAPTWARGVAAREGAVARQMVLYGLAVCGANRFGQALGTMRTAYASRLAGGVPAPLPALGDPGEGVAAD